MESIRPAHSSDMDPRRRGNFRRREDAEGNLIGFEEAEWGNGENPPEPAVELDPDFSREVDAHERIEGLSEALETRAANIQRDLQSINEGLEDTRTLASFRVANERKVAQGKAGSWARDDEELEKQRLETAINLNDTAFELGQNSDAVGLAKEYLTYVKKSLAHTAPETDILQKTIETIEGEEVELAALEATGRADERQQKRLKTVQRAKAILKSMNPR